MSTAELITIAAAAFNGVVVPGGLWALKRMIDEAADKRVGGVRRDLQEHEEHDDRRFSETEEHRNEQHKDNQVLLHDLRTKVATMQNDMTWVKGTLMKLP